MDKLIQTIQVLNKAELKFVNDKINERCDDFGHSTVFAEGGSGSVLNSEFRTSSGFTCESGSELESVIHRAMETGLKEYRRRVKELNYMFQFYPVPGSVETFFGREPIQILSYQPSQEYVFHHDTCDFPEQTEYHRTLSTVLYLTDDFEGGGTEFPHQVYKPKAGQGLFFPSNWCYPHSGQKVISGNKKVAVTWWYAIRESQG
jgi:hypothetical protein